MSIPIPITKENADEKARRVRLLRIWTDICAMAMCEMPEGRSENMVMCDMSTYQGVSRFTVMAGKLTDGGFRPSSSETVTSSAPNAEDALLGLQRRLKPYVA